MKELFYVHSKIERIELQDTLLSGGNIYWFILGSPERTNNDPALIEGYDGLDPVQRVYCEEFLDELFTAPEVVKLAGFLSNVQNEGFQLSGDVGDVLITRKVKFPIGGEHVGYRHMPVGGGKSRYALNLHEKYDLPFEVQGYIDVTEVDLDERMNVSIQYIRRALQALNVDARIKLAEIEDVVRMLYKRDALYVTDAVQNNIMQNVELLDRNV